MNARQARDVERWAAEDAAAKEGACALCKRARRQWSDLCDDCNDAFQDLAEALEDAAAPATAAMLEAQGLGPGVGAEPAQVAGQLELEEEELDLDRIMDAVWSGKMDDIRTVDLDHVLRHVRTLAVRDQDLIKGELWRRS